MVDSSATSVAMAVGDTERVFLAFRLPVIDADRFWSALFLNVIIVLACKA